MKKMIMFRMTLANLSKKKLRTCLIILSILLSTSLLYTVFSLSKTTSDVFEQKIKKEVGTGQLLLTLPKDSESFTLDPIDTSNISNLEYAYPSLQAYGFSKQNNANVQVSLKGIEPAQYEAQFQLNYLEKSKEPFEDNSVILGEETASAYGLTLGDEFNVTFIGHDVAFKVWGIVADGNNPLAFTRDNLNFAMPLSSLQTLLGTSTGINMMTIKSVDGTDLAAFETQLKEAYPDWEVTNIENSSDIKSSMNMIIIPLTIMVVAVLMVSMFIIYSSFKIIAIERMPFMGTLRSIGATKKQTIVSMLMESVFYGFIGGVLGNLLGLVILSFTMKFILSSFKITFDNMNTINPTYLLIAFVAGLLLSVTSAFVPILKTAKMSIRSIIFGEIQNEKHTSPIKLAMGAVMMIAGFIVFQTAPLQLKLPLDLLASLLVAIGAAMLVPLIAEILSQILRIVLKPFFKNNSDLIATNIRNDKTLMNNIVLLSVGLGVILMINNFSSSVGKAVLDVYGTSNADAIVMYSDMDDAFLSKVAALDGVSHLYATNDLFNITANKGTIDIPILEGISGPDMATYGWSYFQDAFTDTLTSTFRSERSLIVTQFMAQKYDLAIGDTISLDFKAQAVPYKVIAIVPMLMNNGNMMFIYDQFLAQDADIANKSGLYLNVKEGYDIESVVQQVKELMPYSVMPIKSLKQMREDNMAANNGIFSLMKSVSLIAMFIGVVGIFNNFVVSFMSRRKFMATMRSLGLSKKNAVKLFMTEALICGLIGALTGLAYGSLSLYCMKFVVNALGIPSNVVQANPTDFIFVFVSGILIALISAFLPALNISKENIVSQLKYE